MKPDCSFCLAIVVLAERRAYATVLRLSVCRRLSVTLCIVAKRCVLWAEVTIESL